MRAFSLDLRERIVAACDRGTATQQQIAERFEVSLGMVKKLLKQRRRTGDLTVRYHACGPKPKIQPSHRMQLRALLVKKPDLTLKQLRDAIDVDCTIQPIHYVLADMGLTYKKKTLRAGWAPHFGPFLMRQFPVVSVCLSSFVSLEGSGVGRP